MKNRVVLLSAVLASVGVVALAASIDGKWTVTTQGRAGDQTQTLVLSSSGMTLKGTLDNGRGGMPVEISEVMIHDSDVTFKVTGMGRDGTPQVTTYTGKLDGDDLKLTPMRAGGGGGGGGAKGGGGGAPGAGGGGGGGGRGPMELDFKRAK
jgi:hypothetical protein